ncbi:NAD(+) synthase, partial [Anaerotruncus colihominis]|uniref:NAD(+) synthase n=1 Tax=Anaerotruncus colihominis TaxID=169435 RepID=UPI0026E96E5F
GSGPCVAPWGGFVFNVVHFGSFCVCVELGVVVGGALRPRAGVGASGATVIANLSASVVTVGKDDYRRALVTGQSGRLVCGYLYANAGEGESTTDLVFSGHSMIAENGSMLAQTGRFEQTMAVSEIDVQRLTFERRRLTTFPARDAQAFLTVPFSMPPVETKLTRPVPALVFVPPEGDGRDRCCADILQVQAHGLKKRLDHSKAETAVVGISGGLDSALALLVCVRAVELLGRPRTDVHAVTMPCFGTTARTRSNAQIICERLGVTFSCVDITASVRRHFDDIGHDEAVRDVTFENAQARERTQVLMDIANQMNGLVVGTGDLSELALGWATYNGDQMSMYGVNASVPKTMVRHLVAYEARQACDDTLRAALCDILDTPVSPELLPPDDGAIAQKTEDLVGPYELHDFFLYHMLRWGFSPRKTLRLALCAFGQAYPRETILYWMRIFYRRFFAQQFKRSCMPDGPKIGSVSLSPRGDWRMPSDASAALWISEVEKL